jgi:hypothetical protein
MKSKLWCMRGSLCIVVFLLTGVYSELKAQQGTVNPLIPPRLCATMEQDSINRLRFPERGTLEDFELALQRKIQVIRSQRMAGRTMAGVVSIPIIVHSS